MKLFLASLALLSGCALPAFQSAERPLGPGEVRSAAEAQETLVVGETTKSDVRAALGPATTVDFASGYEVWVYRQPPVSPAPGAELVLLFDPGGVLAKMRVTPISDPA
ncbi:MAG TPA: hypothetical protein VFC18_08050 [Burkholderiales bacterium]|nr:hypothetical protein [Burkholderiales bacterium]